MNGMLALGRAAFDDTGSLILISEAWAQEVRHCDDWVCVVQLIEGNEELRPEASGRALMHTDVDKADAMPANQAFVAIGFAVGGKGVMDDAFLVEYGRCEDSVLGSLPRAVARAMSAWVMMPAGWPVCASVTMRAVVPACFIR